MKHILLVLSLLTIFGCDTSKKDYVLLEGEINNPNSDSLLIRNQNLSKVFHLDENNRFSDTLKVEPGIYMLYDGKETASIFLKNGYELELTIDTEAFDETISFEGNGAEQSNFLAKKGSLEEELLDLDALSSLNESDLKLRLSEIKSELENFYKTNSNIDSLIVTKGSK